MRVVGKRQRDDASCPFTFFSNKFILSNMALALSSTKTRFRFDSSVPPVLTATGITNFGKLKVNQDLYVALTNATPYTYNPLNRSDDKTLQLRNVARPTWTNGTNVALDSLDPKKSTANSDSGSHTDDLDSNCAIEGKVTTNDKKCGLSLQSGAIEYTVNGEHTLLFQDDGFVAVYEGGIRKDFTLRPYAINDVGLIDKDGDIIRYYLIRDGVMELLRTTRSQLTEDDINAVIILYNIGTKFENAFIYENEKTSVPLEVVGVLEDFQDWFNDFLITSLGQQLIAQDGKSYTSYPNGKKRLRSLNATRGVVSKAERLAFTDFFNWHLNEKEFIFIDNAKKDVNNKGEWFWAQFGSPFTDKTMRSCLSAESATIIETARKDIIPLEFYDDTPPSVPIFTFSNNGTGGALADWDTAIDEESEVTHYELRIRLGS